MKKVLTILLIIPVFFFFSCGASSSDQATEETTEEAIEGEIADDVEAKIVDCGFPIASKTDFINYVLSDGMPKTFQAENGDYLFFRADGTMAGGGNDGEGSMWEANWSFSAGDPTGQITFTVTMEAGTGSKALSGAYNVEMFPDDGALILNCVDYFQTQN